METSKKVQDIDSNNKQSNKRLHPFNGKSFYDQRTLHKGWKQINKPVVFGWSKFKIDLKILQLLAFLLLQCKTVSNVWKEMAAEKYWEIPI